MRFLRAAEILRQLDGQDGAAPAEFAWRNAWLARRSLVAPAMFRPSSPLRQIPGLKYGRLLGLFLADRIERPVRIATAADALQVGETGHRLRAFTAKDKSTLKVVRENSHYGPATRREVALRASLPDRPGLLIPRLLGHESRGGFLFVREELVAGRAFSLRRDRPRFAAQVVTPLAAFYRSWGVAFLPLSEALGPLTAFLGRAEEAAATPPRLRQLLADNPPVAVSQCHNDVVPSNLAVTREGVYFLDWGTSSLGLCGRDFVRIGHRYLGDATIRRHMDALIRDLHRSKLCLDDVLLVREAFNRYHRHHGDWRLETGIADAAAAGLDRVAGRAG